ncbi:MAG: hypothetical protein ACI959_000251, partial [Limisphaerales bacterium]
MLWGQLVKKKYNNFSNLLVSKGFRQHQNWKKLSEVT